MSLLTKHVLGGIGGSTTKPNQTLLAGYYVKCYYCAEELKEKAIICRYCGQNLLLMKDNELLQEEVSSLEKKVLELTASRDVQQTSEWYFVDKLINTEPNRWRISLAVVLPSLIAFVSVALYLLLTQTIDEWMMNNTASATSNVEYLSEDLATSLGIGIVQSILILSWFFAPLPFGFWAGLSLPGNNLKRYILLGLLVGFLTMTGVIGAHMLTVGVDVLAAASLRDWMELSAFSFFGPALF